jgi:hypothetical protein
MDVPTTFTEPCIVEEPQTAMMTDTVGLVSHDMSSIFPESSSNESRIKPKTTKCVGHCMYFVVKPEATCTVLSMSLNKIMI